MWSSAMWSRTLPLVSFALMALGSASSESEEVSESIARCPKRRTSPAREILCYTSSFDTQLLADTVCSCTTLVHQNHDVRNLSIHDITDLRRSLREMHPPLQFVISINDPAKTLRTSATLRQEIIARIIVVLKEVDGVELNMTAGSKERLYNFVRSLRDEMLRKSYDKRIFIALPAKSEDLAKQYELKKLAKYIDLFTLPTDYLTDNEGAFVTFHPSRLIGLFDMLNTDSLVDLISGLGTPKRKILVSLPASAYKFTLKNEHENAPRSNTTEKEPVAIDREQLCDAMNHGEWTVERDEDLTAPYAFQNRTWIAFEDKVSVGIKGKYALLRDLAGLAVRNIEDDMKTECEEPLTREIYRSFTEFQRKTRQAVLDALGDELRQAQFSYPNQAKTSNFRVARVVDTEGHIRAVRENTQTEFVCKRQGYFVHPKSCNRFYRCVKFNQAIENYSVFEFDCPAGLSFDERTEVCVWPGSLPQGSPCPGSSEIAPVVPKRFECPRAPGYYADPQNCRWFFACIDLGGPELMAFEFRCPYGLVFDETKLVCEWPWLVPACSESGTSYSRTEYDYGGRNTAGTSAAVGVGGYVTGALPEYSVGAGYSAGADYSGATGTTGAHRTSGINYVRERTYDVPTGASISDAATFHGSSGPPAGRYGGSIHGERGGSLPSVPPYSRPPGSYTTGSHGVDSASPGLNVAGADGTGYFTSSGGAERTVSAGGIGPGYAGSTGGINAANVGSFGGAGTGYSGYTTGGYSGRVSGSQSSTGEGAFYSRTPDSGYSESTVRGYTGTTGENYFTGEGVSYRATPGAGYFGSTGLSGSSVDGSSRIYTKSGALGTSGYSASTDIYRGRQPSSGEAAPSYGAASVPIYTGSGVGITGSGGNEYGVSIPIGKTDGGYSEAVGGAGPSAVDVNLSTISGIRYDVVQGTTGSRRVPGTDFLGGTSKPSGIPVVTGQTGVRPTDSGYFASDSTRFTGAPAAASSTGVRYTDDGVYTVPVFVQQEGPIYPSFGTTAADARDHTRTHGVSVAGGYGKTDTARPYLNVSIFGGIPVGYGAQGSTTATVLSGNSISTGDSVSGSIFGHGGVHGAVSTVAIDQSAILRDGGQPGYVRTSSGTPGYVVNEDARTVDVHSGSSGILIHGTPTPAVSIAGPSTPSIVLKGDVTPYTVPSGQIAPGTLIGGPVQAGTVVGPTDKPYVQQSRTSYHGADGVSAIGGSVTYSSAGLTPTSSQGRKTDAGRVTGTFNTNYFTGKYSENDIPDYRPTSATLPDTIVSGGRTDGSGGVILGSSLAGPQGSSTPASGYSPIQSAVFTPSGFTKTGPTRTGITTAVLGGGGSYSLSTGESRPTPNPENIGERAFEGSVAGYTKSSSTGGYFSSITTPQPVYPSSGQVTSRPVFPGYSYPKPDVQLGTDRATFSSTPISPSVGKVPITTPTPFPGVEMRNESPAITGVFGSKLPTVPDDRLLTPTIRPVARVTESNTYRTTLSTIRYSPADHGYGTVTAPTNFYIPSPSVTENLSGGTRQSGASAFTTRYDVSTITARPGLAPGVTYKRPTDVTGVTYKGSIAPTGFRSDQGGSTVPSLGTAADNRYSTKHDISKGAIDKLITNYDRGTARYTPNVYDTYTSSGFESTRKFSSKPSLFGKSDGTFPSGPTMSSYEVTTKSAEGRGKVIVKWSDLHPLLLSKLDADCTCKADPFATLRGPAKKLYGSSKDNVDLANYDESEIYVDLYDDYSSEETTDYATNYGDSSPKPYKLSPKNFTMLSTSSYLPPAGARDSAPAIDVRTGVSSRGNPPVGSSSGARNGLRTGKKLKDVRPSTNLIATVEDEDVDEIINGATDCARPGLFRHPGLCNKFYACHWDQWKKKFTLHVFNCPVHLTFDSKAGACNWPSKGPACQAGNLLV